MENFQIWDNYEYHIYIATIFTSAVSHLLVRFLLLYCLRRINLPAKFGYYSDFDWSRFISPFVSSCNAITVSISCICILLSDDNLHKDTFWARSVSTNIMGCFQAGYFLSDIFILTMSGTFLPARFSIIAHHIISLIGYYLVIVHKLFAFYACVRTLTEVSTPFLSVRALLSGLGRTQGKFGVLNGILLGATFFICRIIPIPHIYQDIFSNFYKLFREQRNISVLFVTISILMDILNVYWYFLIIKGIFKYFIGERDSLNAKSKDQ